MDRSAAYNQLAIWLQRHHPDVFARVLSTAQKLNGLSNLYRGRFAARRESSRATFGDYVDYSTVASDIASTASSASDVVDMLPEITVTADAGGGGTLLDSISSGPGDLANQISAQTAIADVTPITTPIEAAPPADVIPTQPVSAPSVSAQTVGQTLANNANLIRAVTAGAATIVSANNAAQVIQAQANRAAAGLAPANVSYLPVTDSSTGIISTVPVLNTGTGQLPLSTAGINALAPQTFLQKYGLYIMLGLAGFVLATAE